MLRPARLLSMLSNCRTSVTGMPAPRPRARSVGRVLGPQRWHRVYRRKYSLPVAPSWNLLTTGFTTESGDGAPSCKTLNVAASPRTTATDSGDGAPSYKTLNVAASPRPTATDSGDGAPSYKTLNVAASPRPTATDSGDESALPQDQPPAGSIGQPFWTIDQ